ncbi:long-chain-fatty-acid-CoA ligase [Novymonas esmeraldas]|uniref:Long-chain-fatty-acid-CoA ligase n=1 Tax=Novymonas esmeraldas TaxID=1808958 RepID=A0AAW0EM75_9TRYP
MGTVLVSLLQTRSDQSVYPNVCAVRLHQRHSCQHPCSVPLRVVEEETAHARRDGLRSGSDECDGGDGGGGGARTTGATTTDSDTATHTLEAPRACVQQDIGPTQQQQQQQQQRQPAPKVASFDDQRLADDAPAADSARLQLARLLMVKSTPTATSARPSHTPTSGERAGVTNALYHYTLPGVTPATGAPARLHESSSPSVTDTTTTTAAAATAAAPPPLPATLCGGGATWHDRVRPVPSSAEDVMRGALCDVGGADEVDAALGTLDCADAFQYYIHSDGDAPSRAESIVYAAPHMAHVSSTALRTYYLHQQTAQYAAAPRGSSSSTAAAASAASWRRGSAGDASWSPQQQQQQQAPLSHDVYASHVSPASLHDALRASIARASHTNVDAAVGDDHVGEMDKKVDSRCAVAAANVNARTPPPPPPNAGRFVSLVEEVATACGHVGAAPLVCWRGIDRVSPLSPDDPLLHKQHQQQQQQQRRGGRGGGATATTGDVALDSAIAEAEDDETFCCAATDADGGHVTPPPQLYYLGPQQYMTGAVWWSRVEAFACGLRSMGLRPGEMLGISADTRWEWLVSCYAAWSVGLVVVAFSGAATTLARVALDTAADLRAVVCGPATHRAMRVHLAAAAATAAATVRSARRPPPSTPTTPWSGDDEVDGGEEDEEDVGGRAGGDGSVDVDAGGRARRVPPRVAAAAGGTRATRSAAARTQRAGPLFIVIRSAGPPRGRGDTRVPPSTQGQSHATPAAAPRPWWSRTTASEPPPPQQQQQQQSPSTLRRGGGDAVVAAAELVGDEEEEEEALWWSDVLMHGEAKLLAWRQRKVRERRLQHQQQLARLRRYQHQRLSRAGGDDEDAFAATTSAATALLLPALVGHAVPGARHVSGSCLGTDAPLHSTASAAAMSHDGSESGVHAANTAPMVLLHSSSSADPAVLLGSTSGGGGSRRPSAPVVSVAPTASPAALQDSIPPPTHMLTDAPPPPLPLVQLRQDDLAFILYTDGDPAGVLLTHGAMKASVAAWHEFMGTTDIDGHEGLRRAAAAAAAAAGNSSSSSSSNIVKYAAAAMPALRSRTAPSGRPSYMAYLPLHDVCEFVAETAALLRGLIVCYGTRRTLLDALARPHGDLMEFAPTILPAVPATLARLRRVVASMVSTGYRGLLFEGAYEARRQALRRGLQTPFLLSTMLAPSRELLGGRCRLVLVRGPAALHPHAHEFLEVVCGASVVQSYATAETGGCGLQQAYCAAQLDSLGGPLGPVHLKLRDVVAVAGVRGWMHAGGRPTGELLLRGPTITAGYHHQPERTAAVLERRGWLHTGDVVERCPDGSLRRLASLRPHHATTSNSRCIALEPLEAAYARHPLCTAGGVCVLVHPYRRYLCALVLTDEEHLLRFLRSTSTGDVPALRAPTSPVPPQQQQQQQQHDEQWSWTAQLSSGWPQCLGDAALNDCVAASLASFVTRDGAVAPHERVRHVRVLYDVWDAAHHTRTATGRLRRDVLHRRYSDLIHELFTDED